MRFCSFSIGFGSGNVRRDKVMGSQNVAQNTIFIIQWSFQNHLLLSSIAKNLHQTYNNVKKPKLGLTQKRTVGKYNPTVEKIDEPAENRS